MKTLIAANDYLLLDGTFYSKKEVNFRNVKEIPHPFVEDTVSLLDSILKFEEKQKIFFIHLNHTNPLLNTSSEEYSNLVKKGYRIVKQDQIFFL